MESFIPDMLILNLLFFGIGLALIIKASDLFLDSAVWFAKTAGIPQVIVGATIVSLCTTLPEMVSSCVAAYRGTADMALGNAIGSVACNTGLILGILLLFVTARVQREVFLIRGAFMIGSIVIALMLAYQGGSSTFLITRAEGGVLLIMLAVYMIVNLFESIHMSKDLKEDKNEERPVAKDWLRHAGLFALGAVGVTIGAYILIAFGQRLARNLGVNEAIISMVFIALGTSLPEFFTAIAAIKKKAENVSVGNIFGANFLNIAMVVGSSAIIMPLTPKTPADLQLGFTFSLIMGVALLCIGLIKGVIGRKTGISMLLLYGTYLAFLFLG